MTGKKEREDGNPFSNISEKDWINKVEFALLKSCENKEKGKERLTVSIILSFMLLEQV